MTSTDEDFTFDESENRATVGVRELACASRHEDDDEVARINGLADELNREAEDVLEYQVTAE